MYKDDCSERLFNALCNKDLMEINNCLLHVNNINAPLDFLKRMGFNLSAFQVAIISLGKHPQTPVSTMILDLLVNAGAKISEVYDDGHSPFHAVTRNNFWVIDYLTSKGVDINIQDQRGKTVFHLMRGWEMNSGVKKSWDKLINLHPDFNLQDTDGNTPLHLITNIRMVGIMLKNGARLDIQNHKGQYPDEAMAESYGGENAFTKRLRDRRIAQEARALKKLCAQSSPKALSRQRL